jgi:hypothetical protein
MMTTMFGLCCAGGCACAPADPASESDISVAIPMTAAQDRVCKPRNVLRKLSRMLGGLFTRMQSDITSPSCM